MRRLILPILLLVAAAAAPSPALVSVCFVPGDGCAERIVGAIDQARTEVRVQAYGFSATSIIAALAGARRRGVDVAVILDHSDERKVCDTDAELLAAGVPIWIDHPPGIAHNKIIVIDRRVVIGGSYNYTASAERRNAENATFIDSEAVAARFLANWSARQAVSAAVAACASTG
jgi:phosphatidylserine/phosphatidylglycerophosphate/cardiolipin synthase-like enzyme